MSTPPSGSPKAWLTTKEAAEYLSVTEETIKRKAREGIIKASKVGQGWRFSRTGLDGWLRKGGDSMADPRGEVEDIIGCELEAACEAAYQADSHQGDLPVTQMHSLRAIAHALCALALLVEERQAEARRKQREAGGEHYGE